LSFGAQHPFACIEKSVGFKDTALGDAESGSAEQTAARGGILDGQFNFDFARTGGGAYNFLPMMA
jgi:hypothetical protein